MFNPYTVRPVGSRQYEVYLLDLMTSKEYERQEKESAVPIIPVQIRKEPSSSKYSAVEEAWFNLAAAIKGMAVHDYLQEYLERLEAESYGDRARAEVHESRCLTMENEYFRQTEEDSGLLDRILREVIHGPGRYQRYRIKEALRRLSKVIY